MTVRQSFGKLWEDIYACESLAAAMLLSALQRLCVKRAYALEFEYALSESVRDKKTRWHWLLHFR